MSVDLEDIDRIGFIQSHQVPFLFVDFGLPTKVGHWLKEAIWGCAQFAHEGRVWGHVVPTNGQVWCRVS